MKKEAIFKSIKSIIKGIAGFLREDAPQSSTRLISITCTVMACVIAYLGIINNKDLLQVSALVSALLTAATGTKVLSKRYEVNTKNHSSVEEDNPGTTSKDQQEIVQ